MVYSFVSNILQEFVKHTDTLASLFSDHSPILVSVMKSVIPQRGGGLWKFNCPFLQNAKFIEAMKNHITASVKNFDEENIRNEHIWWVLLKIEMRKYSIKQISLESNKRRKDLREKS